MYFQLQVVLSTTFTPSQTTLERHLVGTTQLQPRTLTPASGTPSMTSGETDGIFYKVICQCMYILFYSRRSLIMQYTAVYSD